MSRESFASLAARAVFEDGMVLVDDEAWTREEWEVKAKQAAYMAAYRQRAEVKAKQAAYYQRPEAKAKRAAYMAAYYQRPEAKAKRAAERIVRLEAKLAALRAGQP